MQSRYPGICKTTGKPYEAGSEIRKGPNGWELVPEGETDNFKPNSNYQKTPPSEYTYTPPAEPVAKEIKPDKGALFEQAEEPDPFADD